jgi:4'-phosphopantetheinyl transferase
MAEIDFASPLGSTAAAWVVALPEDHAGLDEAWVLLSDAEQSRADRFRAAPDRAGYIYGHAALRILLEAQLRRPLARRPFDVHPRGKPYLAGEALGFNFSRARGTAAIALAGNGDIGVDIEAIVADGSSAGIARAGFSSEEREWMERAADAEERLRRFYRLWVIREAAAKASGEGIARALPDVAVHIKADAPALATGSRWRLSEAPPLAGHAAAVVVEGERTVTWRETTWAELRRWRAARSASTGS